MIIYRAPSLLDRRDVQHCPNGSYYATGLRRWRFHITLQVILIEVWVRLRQKWQILGKHHC